MAKPTITTRAGKGSALTWTEGDTNLTNLRDATITVKADTGGTDVVSDLNGTVTLVAGTNVTITGDNTAKTVTINSTASGGATTLDGLTDVVITAAATNDVLVYNGTNWVDTAANTLTVSAASTATTATGATNINISTTTGNAGDTTLYPVLVGAASTGNQLPHIDSVLSYNATTDTLNATTFAGSLTGNASSATYASAVTLTADNTTNATNYPLFVNAATGNLSPRTDTGFTYNPSTGLLTTGSLQVNGVVNLNPTADVSIQPSGAGNVTILPSGTGNLIIGSAGSASTIDSCTIGSISAKPGTFTNLTSTGLTTLKTYKETVYAGGSQTTAYTPNYSNGTVHTVTMGGNVTFAAPTNMASGNSLTLILTQDATGGRTGTWNASYKWAGGTPTLSTTANAVDVVNIFYDGTNYLSSISKQDNSSTVTGLQINAAGELRLADSDSSNYVGFKSPATVSTNKIWTLPSADGTSGQVLSTDGAGALSWATAGGGNNIIVISAANAAGINFGATANSATTTTFLLRSAGGTGATVSTNTFTLPAGTYQIMFPFSTSSNASKGDWHIYNSTDATTLVTFNYDSFTLGGLSVAMYGSPTYNFTIAASKTFTIRTTTAVTGGWTLQSGHWSAGYVFQINKTA